MIVMQKNRISCLPVLNDRKKLVGIITERDIVSVAGQLLDFMEKTTD